MQPILYTYNKHYAIWVAYRQIPIEENISELYLNPVVIPEMEKEVYIFQKT